jgi:hypothetical protein
MSEQHAKAHINRVVKIFNEEQLEPRDRAIILASLAQAEATLELVERFRDGIRFQAGTLDALEKFASPRTISPAMWETDDGATRPSDTAIVVTCRGLSGTIRTAGCRCWRPERTSRCRRRTSLSWTAGISAG